MTSNLDSFIRPLAYLSVPLLLLRPFPTGWSYFRQAVYIFAMLAVAVCTSMVAAGMTMVGRRADVSHMIARTFWNLIGRLMGVDVDVEGEDHLYYVKMDDDEDGGDGVDSVDEGRKGSRRRTGPAVIMMNHQSMLDVLIVGRMMPRKTTIMAKSSLLYSPLGPFMALSGTIFVDRGNNRRAVESLVTAGLKMKTRGMSLWMFPEGTRTLSEKPEMKPLKKGGFHLALQADAVIVPVVAQNYWGLYHSGWFGQGAIKVKVLPPISTKGYTVEDIPKLATIVQEQMFDALQDMSPFSQN